MSSEWVVAQARHPFMPEVVVHADGQCCRMALFQEAKQINAVFIFHGDRHEQVDRSGLLIGPQAKPAYCIAGQERTCGLLVVLEQYQPRLTIDRFHRKLKVAITDQEHAQDRPVNIGVQPFGNQMLGTDRFKTILAVAMLVQHMLNQQFNGQVCLFI